MLEVSGANLRHIDPVPIIVDQYNKLNEPIVCADKLRCVVSALYDNALNHGVLEISDLTSPWYTDEDQLEDERARRFSSAAYGFVRIEVQRIMYQGMPSLLVKLEDSGRGFDYMDLFSSSDQQHDEKNQACIGSIQRVRKMCQSLRYQGRGNRVEAIVGGQG